MRNATDPTHYEAREINGRTLLRCKDCGRESLFNSREVKHSPRCDIAPRRTVTVATIAQAPALRRGRPEATVVHDGHTYTAVVVRDGRVTISEDGVWAGEGRYTKYGIEDCPAILGDEDASEEIYRLLDAALASA